MDAATMRHRNIVARGKRSGCEVASSLMSKDIKPCARSKAFMLHVLAAKRSLSLQHMPLALRPLPNACPLRFGNPAGRAPPLSGSWPHRLQNAKFKKGRHGCLGSVGYEDLLNASFSSSHGKMCGFSQKKVGMLQIGHKDSSGSL